VHFVFVVAELRRCNLGREARAEAGAEAEAAKFRIELEPW